MLTCKDGTITQVSWNRLSYSIALTALVSFSMLVITLNNNESMILALAITIYNDEGD
jgi:hypothetical protein